MLQLSEPDHTAKKCQSKFRCKTCSAAHNSLLHIDRPAANSAHENTVDIAAATTTAQVLLQTAIIPVHNNRGEIVKCRAMLDTGSQLNLITNSCRSKLELPMHKSTTRYSVVGTGNAESIGKSQLKIQLKGAVISAEMLVMSGKLTLPLPSSTFTKPLNLPNITLADPNFNIESDIDIIIGAEFYESLRRPGREVIGNMFLTNTVFGYVISGSTASKGQTFPSVSHMMATDDSLTKFWEIEEVPQTKAWSASETKAVAHFDATTRDDTGRFIVDLPKSNPPKLLGDSYKQARDRFIAQEKRLTRHPDLKAKYCEFIKEFEELGHLEDVPKEEVDNGHANHFYLPHHAVFKESSTTTKLRVVFDASAKTTTGVSLNDTLLVGPTIQDTIFYLIIRFRFHKIGFTADVAKMYRQIGLTKDARNFHRILWRDNPDDEIQHKQMTRVTYGIGSSAYHSIRALQETAKSTTDDAVKQAIMKDFYVDDLLSGADNLDNAKRIQDGIINILQSGQFSIRKWISNAPQLIERLPEELRGTDPFEVKLADSASVKTLGITWNHVNDNFEMQASQPEGTLVTKRNLLSICAKLFDPIGWLTPATIRFKIWIQKAWALGIVWDDPLPENFIKEFTADVNDIYVIANIQIPRRITCDNATNYEIHCFTDASMLAYAAAAYLVICKPNNERQSHLISAKARVAPMKTISLPRLELCAAQLGVKLVMAIQQAMSSVVNVNEIEFFGWSDSTITLAWINAQPNRWSTFVANRVAEIQDVIPPSKWSHVPTKLNPADAASRGTFCSVQICGGMVPHFF